MIYFINDIFIYLYFIHEIMIDMTEKSDHKT